MTKKVIIVGPRFGELIFKQRELNIELLEEIWIKFKKKDSEAKMSNWIKQLKNFQNNHIEVSQHTQFINLVNNLDNMFDYRFDKDEYERLALFKEIVAESMNNQSNKLDDRVYDLLGSYLQNYDYVLSYRFDNLIEELMGLNNKPIICKDRRSFLLSENEKNKPILYKLFGSFDQVETMKITGEEKQVSDINLRLAISKVTQFESLSISLIGFGEEDKEYQKILDEIGSKDKVVKVSLFKRAKKNSEVKKYHQINQKSGVNIEIVSADLESYLIENSNLKETASILSDDEFLGLTRKKRKVRKKNSNLIKIHFKTKLLFALILVCMIGFNFFFSLATINGESMAPSFKTSDYVVLNKQYNKVNRFDVIAFDSPDEHGEEYIKRVIGLPGDAIEYIDDQLYINGNQIEESYLDREKGKLSKGEIFTKDFSLEELSGVKEVPQNKLFVLGDNRLYSRDSRNFGFIDLKDIKGDVKIKIWPMR